MGELRHNLTSEDKNIIMPLALSDDARLSVAYIGPKSRTERPRETKIGPEVAHVTRDSETTFKVKRSTCRGRAYCGGLPHSLFLSASTNNK